MKKLIILLLFPLLISAGSRACTSFLLHYEDQIVFGRNYDWVTGNGMICVNSRGVVKTSLPTSDGEVIHWTALYGSISFNQYGKEFPTGGMNERGLVVELMWLDGTKYPAKDERPSIGVLQWIQYQLDNAATVEEVIQSDKLVRITSEGTPLHYLVADASGAAATIEFLDGKMVVHKGDELPFPVLTNTRYDQSVGVIERKSSIESMDFKDNSLERFARACNMLSQYGVSGADVTPVKYAFKILGEVAQGSHTKWSIVYDISSRRIHFMTLGFNEIKTVSFDAFDLSCNTPPVSWDLNQPGNGDISDRFETFTAEFNRELVERSAEETRPQFSFSEESIRRIWQYAGSLKCQ